jgi:PAS domain S-box-containing protein
VLQSSVEMAFELFSAYETTRENEERYRRISEGLTDYLYTVRVQNGRAVETRHSKACVVVTGYTSEEFEGSPYLWIDMVTPEDRSRVIEHVEGVLSGTKMSPIEHRIVRKDGQVRWVRDTPIPRVDSGGRLVSYDGVVKDITDRKLAEEALKTSLGEKEVLLKEIHHRVKNNLQVISSLLNLQSHHIYDQRDAEVFRTSMNRIRSMALVHDKLYRSESLASVYFPGYIDDLVRELLANYSMGRSVELDLRVDPITVAIDHAIPLGLIINELVSNVLKHAFPEGTPGIIAVHLNAQGEKIILIVSDNGVGFPADIDFTDTQSLGMQLVVTLVEQLDGTIELHRGKGTEFRITFEPALA